VRQGAELSPGGAVQRKEVERISAAAQERNCGANSGANRGAARPGCRAVHACARLEAPATLDGPCFSDLGSKMQGDGGMAIYTVCSGRLATPAQPHRSRGFLVRRCSRKTYA